MNAKLKNKGYIVKSRRRRLDAIPLVHPHREAVIPVAPAPSQFQKSVQNSRQKLHSLQEEPQLVATPPPSEKSAPFHSSSMRKLQAPSNHQSPEISKSKVESCVRSPQNTKHSTGRKQSSKSHAIMANTHPVKGIILIWHNNDIFY